MDPLPFVYKTVDDCKIEADVFGAEPGARKPVLVWIHGGGLIFGTRAWRRATLFAKLVEAGALVVSIDHRLAPETKLPEIFGDVLDALRWVREQGPALFGADPDRVALGGASAGAYLSLLGGYRATPLPRAILAFWGYGDITTPWEATPSPHYCSDKYPMLTRDAALAVVGTRPIAAQTAELDRSAFYLYCRQQGRWPIEVAGHEPHVDARWFDPWCPVRNLTAAYPPTMLIHGTVDTDVPYDESQALAARMAAVGAPHEFVTLEGIGHGFAGATPEVIAEFEARAAAFVLARMQ